MKNANIFVEVDMTLVNANGQLLSGAREALASLKTKGCHLFLWSSNGRADARSVAASRHIEDLFGGFAAKPDSLFEEA